MAKNGTVRSMTGFGRATGSETAASRPGVEVRSVNARFFKLNINMSGRLQPLEERIREMSVAENIRRGTVDLSVFFEGEQERESYTVNKSAVQSYLEQAKALAKANKVKSGMTIADVMTLPGVIKRGDSEANVEAIWERLKPVVAEALASYNTMREREGAAIAADIRSHLAEIALHRAAIALLAPEAMEAGIKRFRERIGRLLEKAGLEREVGRDAIEREIVLASDRTDVSEELARLGSHLEQMEGVLAGGGETGKKLDFLTQELLRETNTVGSKTQDERVTRRVVDMKNLIEKIREQVQNLE